MSGSDTSTGSKAAQDAGQALPHGFAPSPAARAETQSLAEIAQTLVDDVREAASAELALFQARAALVGDSARWVAIWGALALFCAFLAITALVFGSILTLAVHVGPLLATLIVTAILLLVTAIGAARARSTASLARRALRLSLDPAAEATNSDGDH